MSEIIFTRFEQDERVEVDLLSILHSVNNEFTPELNTWINLNEYAHKMASLAVCWLAYKQDIPIGFAACYVNKAPLYSFWTMLAVCKEYRNQLVALQLEVNVIKYCREMGSKGIRAEVDPKHTDLLQLHHRFGFQSINTCSNQQGRSWIELKLDFN